MTDLVALGKAAAHQAGLIHMDNLFSLIIFDLHFEKHALLAHPFSRCTSWIQL